MRQLHKNEAKKFFRDTLVKRGFELHLLLENVQYKRNVAAIFRTADAAGVKRVHLTGISETPPFGKDLQKASRKKENVVKWEYEKDTDKVIQKLKKEGFQIIALEITDKSISIDEAYKFTNTAEKVCLIVGNEVYGVVNKTLDKCDGAMYIPMYGKGASLNVAASTAVALFTLR